jgi:hypothetical protein
MKITRRFISTVMPIATLLAAMIQNASAVEQAGKTEAAPTTQGFTKVQLPAGGVFVPQPKDKQVIYYLYDYETPRRLGLEDIAKTKPFSGLYRTTDGGQAWKLLVSYFKFKTLFIHPDSGELFALLSNKVIVPGEDGFLTVRYFNKVARSTDGMHWKDITGKLEQVTRHYADPEKKRRYSVAMINAVTSISIDPEHPHRIRLAGWNFRSFVLTAVDDNYSDWERGSWGAPTF